MVTVSMMDSAELCQTLPCLYHTTLLAGLLSTLQLRVATRLRDTWAGWANTRGPSVTWSTLHYTNSTVQYWVGQLPGAVCNMEALHMYV